MLHEMKEAKKKKNGNWKKSFSRGPPSFKSFLYQMKDVFEVIQVKENRRKRDVDVHRKREKDSKKRET